MTDIPIIQAERVNSRHILRPEVSGKSPKIMASQLVLDIIRAIPYYPESISSAELATMFRTSQLNIYGYIVTATAASLVFEAGCGYSRLKEDLSNVD